VTLSMVTQVQNSGAELSVRYVRASSLNELLWQINPKWIMQFVKILFATMALTCQSPLCYEYVDLARIGAIAERVFVNF
jgi:hypothetical protein